MTDALNEVGAEELLVTFPVDSSTLQHIFRDRSGHLPDTSGNRQMIQPVANDSKNVHDTDKYGNTWHTETNQNGTQTWVRTRNGVVTNSGLNKTPRPYDPQIGLNNDLFQDSPNPRKQEQIQMTLNEKEAFSAMVYYLEAYYNRTKSDEIGGVLGDLNLLVDGKPAEPAAWNDWHVALSKTIQRPLSYKVQL